MNLLKEYDYVLFRLIHHVRAPSIDWLFKLVTNSGLGHIQLLMALPLLWWKQTRRLFWLLLPCVAVAGLLAPLVKRLVPRDRPSMLYDSDPMELIRFGSFPSGHTTTSFAIATVIYLALRHSKYKWVSAIVFLWAILVGISRIYVGVHWPTDVLGGALLGSGVSAMMYAWLAPKILEPQSEAQ